MKSTLLLTFNYFQYLFVYDDVIEFLKPFGYFAYEITRNGFNGPEEKILSLSENYAFLTQEHLKKEQISALVMK